MNIRGSPRSGHCCGSHGSPSRSSNQSKSFRFPRFQNYPRYSYSYRKSDVNIHQLGQLLSTTGITNLDLSGDTTPEGSRYLAKLEVAVQHSLVVVTAYTDMDLYGESDVSLAGFARAIGDGALVATIFDVAVHPACQRQGLGSRLLRLLTNRLSNMGVYDVGAVVPLSARPFFTKCSFAPDRENSSALMYVEADRLLAVEDESLYRPTPHVLQRLHQADVDMTHLP